MRYVSRLARVVALTWDLLSLYYKASWRKIYLSPSLISFVQTSHILLALVKYRRLYTWRLQEKEGKLCLSQWDTGLFNFLSAAMKQEPVAIKACTRYVALKQLRKMSPKIPVISKDRNKIVWPEEWRKVIFIILILCMYWFYFSLRCHILCHVSIFKLTSTYWNTNDK